MGILNFEYGNLAIVKGKREWDDDSVERKRVIERIRMKEEEVKIL